MKKSLLLIVALTVAAASLPVILFASNSGFVLAAISPDKQKVSCIRSHEPNLLTALKNNGFVPKQDDTGFIYSLIGYDGPESADLTSQQNFWSFWIAPSTDSQLAFSNLGPIGVAPEDGHIYVFSFGNGSTPTLPPTAKTICEDQPPAAQTPPTTNQPATNPPQTSSVQYLRNNYGSMGKADQDWAAMALGSHNADVSVTDTTSTAATSLARVALAKAAQGISPAIEVEKIIASFDGNQIGDPSLVNDDIFAVLAIASSNRAWLDTHSQVFTFVAGTQRGDGSFGFSISGAGDVDMTAAALWAMRFSGNFTGEKERALNYLRQAQNNDGGFGFKAGQSSNVPSSAWAALGLRAASESTAATESYLTSNRQSDGSWLFAGQKSNLATSYAVLALSGKQLPITRTKNHPPKDDSPKPQATQNSTTTKPLINSLATFAKSRVRKPVPVFHGCSASASASASAFGSSATASATAKAICW